MISAVGEISYSFVNALQEQLRISEPRIRQDDIQSVLPGLLANSTTTVPSQTPSKPIYL